VKARYWLDRVRQAQPHVLAVAWRTGALVAGLTLLYLAVANLVLMTGVIQRFAAKSDDIRITYDSAYSVWPGRVHVKNLGVRVEDHNVQFWVGVERGTLDVDLMSLARKRFHALRLDGEQVTYRMRHKLSAVGDEGPRVAAYPPIAGFADPPLFTGSPPPPIPDDQYDLWDVEIDQVTANVKEIWVLEYRYRGPGVARGGFHVRPARFYEVRNATLDLAGGKLTLGSKVVAERAEGRIACQVDGSDPRKLEGLEPLKAMTASVDAMFEGTDLAFMDAYLGPHAGLSATGRATLDARAELRRGSIGPGTRLALLSMDASVGNDELRVNGPAVVSLTGSRKAGGPAAYGFLAERVTVSAPKHQGAAPSVSRIEFRAETTSDVTRPLEVVSAKLSETQVDLPDLAWLNGFLTRKRAPRLSGSGTLTLEAERHAERRTRGSARLEVENFRLGLPDGSTEPLRGTLATNVSASAKEPSKLEGTAELHVDRASALLPLLSDSAFLREVESKLLGLGALEARGTYSVGDIGQFQLSEARSGMTRARGYLTAKTGGLTGAFLVWTPAANIGVRVAPSATRVRLFVSDDWLETGASLNARGGLPRPPRGRLSR
jgi:hypothetical protein